MNLLLQNGKRGIAKFHPNHLCLQSIHHYMRAFKAYSNLESIITYIMFMRKLS